MLNFDEEPIALRYMISAFTAFYQNLPVRIVQTYHDRAVEAIANSGRHLTEQNILKYIQTLFVKYQFYFAQGQPAAGIDDLTEAMQLIQDWKFDIDPDMNKNSLLPYEKDERRRIYWDVYYCAKSISLCTGIMQVPQISQKMQPHSQCFLGGGSAAICETSQLLQFAVPIIEYARKTPDSLAFLFSCENQAVINRHVANIKNWQKNLPDHLRISPEKLPELLKSGDFSGILDMVILPSILTCMVYRAVLFTTFRVPLLHSHLLTASTTKFIVSAIKACLHESQNLGEIFQQLLTMTITEKKLGSTFWHGIVGIANGCFEASTVSWFMYRHTLPYFWDKTGLCDKEVRPAIKSRLVLFKQCLCLLQTSQYGDDSKFNPSEATDHESFVSPMLKCVNEMVLEIAHFDDALSIANSNWVSLTDSQVENVIVEMNSVESSNCLEYVMVDIEKNDIKMQDITIEDEKRGTDSANLNSLSSDIISEDSDDFVVLDRKATSLEFDENTIKPFVQGESQWIYLGLLGMDVNQKFQWKAPYEEKWRTFWHQPWDKLAFKLTGALLRLLEGHR
ncbi:hypothetical protein HK100_002705, partial [Physocladia obscura]